LSRAISVAGRISVISFSTPIRRLPILPSPSRSLRLFSSAPTA
jgi:hypothetical protein